ITKIGALADFSDAQAPVAARLLTISVVEADIEAIAAVDTGSREICGQARQDGEAVAAMTDEGGLVDLAVSEHTIQCSFVAVSILDSRLDEIATGRTLLSRIEVRDANQRAALAVLSVGSILPLGPVLTAVAVAQVDDVR